MSRSSPSRRSGSPSPIWCCRSRRSSASPTTSPPSSNACCRPIPRRAGSELPNPNPAIDPLQGTLMSTRDMYVTDLETDSWQVPMVGDARFSWEYDDGRERLLSLYQKGKDKQWDAQQRVAWSLEVDPA